MATKQDHVTDDDLKELHQPRGGAAEMGCLTRHQRRDEGHLCSHQWQAVQKADSDSSLYNKHPRWGKGYKSPSSGYHADLTHFMAPFCHNAHHMVPNGSLNNAISQAGKNLANLIKQGLLKATYNLNDKVNMIILPLKMSDGVILKLPRHLAGDDVGPGEKPEFFSHAKYSQMAQTELTDVMDEFKQLADNAVKAKDKKHELPKFKLSKEQIEFISNQIYDAIKAVGLTKGGQPLSKVADDIKALL